MIPSPLCNSYIKEVVWRVLGLSYGSSLAPVKMNILCYVDNIVLVAPTTTGLQRLLDFLPDIWCFNH